MIIAWIVITLMIALVVGIIGAGVVGDGFGFMFGFIATLQLSFLIGIVYIAAHFIGKFW